MGALALTAAVACLSASTLQAHANKDEQGRGNNDQQGSVNGNEQGAPIVGLWHNLFTSYFGTPFQTYSQWHSDGLENDTPNFMNAVCFGTWNHTTGRTFKLFHVGWTPGGIPPAPTSVRFELRELNTVGQDGNTFDGTYDQKFFDAAGNLVFEDSGTIHATRLTAALY